MTRRVLVVSARMGAGHDGAARELCRRLEAKGIQTRMVDFLDAAPWAGRLIKAVYELQLRAAPWAYEATYRVWFLGPLLCRPLAGVLGLVFGRRIRRWAAEMGANAVVSTYPLSSVVLGRLRSRRLRSLPVPAITFVTDFAVHPLWVHPGVDLNLCVHPDSAAAAEETTGRPARATGPLVADSFRSALPGKARARAALGLPLDARVVLVVAGSWGVGELEQTFDALLSGGRYLPVAVCGRNERLRQRLAARGAGLVLGWTEAMPTLMAASDVLVQNAGGLTCMEAFAVGLPVITFRPIPGHGRQNALDMDRAGVAAYAVGPDDLEATISQVISRSGHMTGLGRAMFSGDAATEVREVALAHGPIPFPVGRPAVRRVTAAGVAVMSLYAGLNLVANAASAAGLDTPRLPAHSEEVTLVVRLGAADLADPGLPALLARDHIAAAVEGRLAQAHPVAVRRLADHGVTVANAGWVPAPDLHLLSLHDNVTRASLVISRATGLPCTLYAPGPTVNASDLAFAKAHHEQIVRGIQLRASTAGPGLLRPGHVYVIDAQAVTGPHLAQWLDALHTDLAAAGITTTPVAVLAR
ncbi:MAG: MGDG synthase family glycosyltransferase [Acidimicrobiales bacterium]